ncbi:hypothetical protein ASPACDRAFT_126369 [Aspergillus aculeatus ATCC 16872]|uniref:Uncharacterized protein n=1 Tax=Aspergillus aculeatus (strain ATCC 16872 / CBS 172.66 / WB 5094) TaxID=690307 RepID=A0A1L9WIT2_ASPA1|nr:uncharacterized protein ASPACDRAFT_126369 [Aspergillus aculeatus ATCC 16872]OJJ96091.1 hypothetical protein ASPACDRAFT_126369 [Aspergillus aculeatus ATCC 16872]
MSIYLEAEATADYYMRRNKSGRWHLSKIISITKQPSFGIFGEARTNSSTTTVTKTATCYIETLPSSA